METGLAAQHQMEMILVGVVMKTVFPARGINLQIDPHVAGIGDDLVAASLLQQFRAQLEKLRRRGAFRVFLTDTAHLFGFAGDPALVNSI